MYSLKQHLKIYSKHIPIKSYQCEQCKFKCAYNSQLINHKRTHSGEKPYQCNLCEYKCAQSSALTQHKKTHSSEKLFVCDICQKRFIHKANLNTHIKTHTAGDIQPASRQITNLGNNTPVVIIVEHDNDFDFDTTDNVAAAPYAVANDIANDISSDDQHKTIDSSSSPKKSSSMISDTTVSAGLNNLW